MIYQVQRRGRGLVTAELDLRAYLPIGQLVNDQCRKYLPRIGGFAPVRAYNHIFRFWVLARRVGAVTDSVRHYELALKDGGTVIVAVRAHLMCAGPRRQERSGARVCVCDPGFAAHDPADCLTCQLVPSPAGTFVVATAGTR